MGDAGTRTGTRRRWLALLAGTVLLSAALGLGAWLALPGQLLRRVHAEGADLGGGYRAQVAAVELTTSPFGYVLRDLRVERREGDAARPLLHAQSVQVRLQPLARRASVAISGLRVQLVAGDGIGAQLGAGVRWRHVLDQLGAGSPVDTVTVDNATLSFARMPSSAPLLEFGGLRGSLQHLTEVPTAQRPAPARLELDARLFDVAPVRIEARFDPHASMQRLNLQMHARDLALTRLNPLLRPLHPVDFAGGSADAELRMVSDGDRVRGRLDTTLRNVDVFDWQQDVALGKGMLAATRELFAGGAATLARNRHGQLQRDYRIDATLMLPDDNLDGLRAVIEAACTNLGQASHPP